MNFGNCTSKTTSVKTAVQGAPCIMDKCCPICKEITKTNPDYTSATFIPPKNLIFITFACIIV